MNPLSIVMLPYLDHIYLHFCTLLMYLTRTDFKYVLHSEVLVLSSSEAHFSDLYVILVSHFHYISARVLIFFVVKGKKKKKITTKCMMQGYWV